MNCGQESGDQENFAATSLATRWLAAILQPDCQEATRGNGGIKGEPACEGKRTESLLYNLVKLVDKDKSFLVRQPVYEIYCEHFFTLSLLYLYLKQLYWSRKWPRQL